MAQFDLRSFLDKLVADAIIPDLPEELEPERLKAELSRRLVSIAFEMYLGPKGNKIREAAAHGREINQVMLPIFKQLNELNIRTIPKEQRERYRKLTTELRRGFEFNLLFLETIDQMLSTINKSSY